MSCGAGSVAHSSTTAKATGTGGPTVVLGAAVVAGAVGAVVWSVLCDVGWLSYRARSIVVLAPLSPPRRRAVSSHPPTAATPTAAAGGNHPPTSAEPALVVARPPGRAGRAVPRSLRRSGAPACRLAGRRPWRRRASGGRRCAPTSRAPGPPSAAPAGSATTPRPAAPRTGPRGSTLARRNVSLTPTMVCWTIGRIISSNSPLVIRTVDVWPGNITGMSVAASDDNDSLASTQLRRRLARAASPSCDWRAASTCSAGTFRDRVVEDGLVEVDPPEPLDAERLDLVLEDSAPATQQGDVEGPAAEVVHQQQRALLDRDRRGVVERRRGGLRHQLGAPEADVVQGLAERPELVLGPVRRMGHHGPRRRLTDLFDDRVVGPTCPSRR